MRHRRASFPEPPRRQGSPSSRTTKTAASHAPPRRRGAIFPEQPRRLGAPSPSSHAAWAPSCLSRRLLPPTSRSLPPPPTMLHPRCCVLGAVHNRSTVACLPCEMLLQVRPHPTPCTT